MAQPNNPLKPGRPGLALALLVPAPALGILAATSVWPDSVVGQIAFGVFKVWLISLPVLWVVLVERRRPRLPPLSLRGMHVALGTGLGMFTIIVGAYLWLGDWIDTAAMVDQIQAVGLGMPAAYIAGAVYWCTINSILEEYVWRWFVFTRCEALMPRVPAVVAAGFFFTIHHTVALSYFFDWRVTLLGSLGVFIGGTTWSWIYLRWRNIYAAYVSHLLADIAIFGIGWHLVFGGGAA